MQPSCQAQRQPWFLVGTAGQEGGESGRSRQEWASVQGRCLLHGHGRKLIALLASCKVQAAPLQTAINTPVNTLTC